MAAPTHYDCIIIGSGQAGNPLAGAFAKAGRKTALIERSHMGGCCVNEGCLPTKTMITSGRIAYHTRRGADYGIHTPGGTDGIISVDIAKVLQRKRDLITSFRSGIEHRVTSAGVDLLKGSASFKDAKTLLVQLNDGSEQTLTGSSIFINVGERPAKPALPGIDSVAPELILDSTSIMELPVLPRHLVVVGGGYVGLEFAQLFRRLGSEVTVFQRADRLLPREDPDLTAALLSILREDGIDVHLNTSPLHLSPSPTTSPPSLTLTYQPTTTTTSTTSPPTLNPSHILFATGRIPNTDSLNLPLAGIATNPRGHILVNEHLETNIPGIYALGDAKGPPAFTHISYDDHRILKANLLSPPSPLLSTKTRLVPNVVYTDPQLAHIGLHEHTARATFPSRRIRTASLPMTSVARALELDESRGLMKAVVDIDDGSILGFSVLGVEGGEVMSIVQMAIMGKVPWQRLRDAVWAHPALAESLNNLWGELEGS
ncbi:MAG: hypothetical protein M1824_006517 [Vezdaea acicularis]|nr:MAG: hypothetical protein M1824_006517 [Vezdaea acicularis]